MLKYLLDTNIVIYVIKRRPVSALEIFNRQQGRMAVSAITVAELVHGAEKSQSPAPNLAVVEDFFSRLTVLPYTAEAAYHYGSIRAVLEKTGQPIGLNGLHIAGHARCLGLTLVTNNTGEFARVVPDRWIDRARDAIAQ